MTARSPRPSWWPSLRDVPTALLAAEVTWLGGARRHRTLHQWLRPEVCKMSERRKDMEDEIRRVLATYARLPVDAMAIAPDADLFRAGMTSHASVNVMLGLEEAFDIEFPEAMLRKATFESIAAIRDAIEELTSVGVSR